MRLRTLSLRWSVVAVAGLLAGPLHAAGSDPASADRPKKSNEIMVPIPGWSPEVTSNGCPVRKSPAEVTLTRQAGKPEIPFWGLISHAAGRHAVRAILDKPEVFSGNLAKLDDDLRRLTLLYALHDGFGRDGLHTFFFLESASHAPAMLAALKEAGLEREHGVFARAMSLFGASYPAEYEERKVFFGYSKSGARLNAFDHALMEVAREFGSREKLKGRIEAYVEATPALFARIEALREKVGENDRLRFLIQALDRKIDWRKPANDIARQLAALPKDERNLVALDMFNMQFENGGVHQFFYNSSGDIAPEVLTAMTDLDLTEQAATFRRALAMVGEPYIRDNTKRRAARFDGKWSGWDDKLSKMTDDFYAIGGGAKAVPIKGHVAFEGGPGFRDAMVKLAREKKMLPC